MDMSPSANLPGPRTPEAASDVLFLACFGNNGLACIKTLHRMRARNPSLRKHPAGLVLASVLPDHPLALLSQALRLGRKAANEGELLLLAQEAGGVSWRWAVAGSLLALAAIAGVTVVQDLLRVAP